MGYNFHYIPNQMTRTAAEARRFCRSWRTLTTSVTGVVSTLLRLTTMRKPKNMVLTTSLPLSTSRARSLTSLRVSMCISIVFWSYKNVAVHHFEVFIISPILYFIMHQNCGLARWLDEGGGGAGMAVSSCWPWRDRRRYWRNAGQTYRQWAPPCCPFLSVPSTFYSYMSIEVRG